MKRLYSWTVIYILITIAALPGYAQTLRLISGTYDSVRFEQLVLDIEKQTPYHFYYDHSATDSLRVSMSFQNSEVASVLGQIFSGTDLHFAVGAAFVFEHEVTSR